jgi:hypothetical protein
MSPRPIDLPRARAGLARLDAWLAAHPELRAPEAQARLAAWLKEDQRGMRARATKHTRGDPQTRARVQRLRERRKREGWAQYELWLDADTAALLARVRQPGESLQAVIHRALQALEQPAAPAQPVRASNVTSHHRPRP